MDRNHTSCFQVLTIFLQLWQLRVFFNLFSFRKFSNETQAFALYLPSAHRQEVKLLIADLGYVLQSSLRADGIQIYISHLLREQDKAERYNEMGSQSALLSAPFNYSVKWRLVARSKFIECPHLPCLCDHHLWPSAPVDIYWIKLFAYILGWWWKGISFRNPSRWCCWMVVWTSRF